MPKISKRVLWGYSAASVDAFLSELQADHEEKCSHLRAQLAELEAANETSRLDAERLQQELQALSELEKQVADLLLQAHVDHTRAVHEKREELQQAANQQEQLLTIRQMHSEAVMQQVLEKLRQLESVVRQKAGEEERGETSGI